MNTQDTTKAAFLNTWPGGYRENFEVYQKATGATEEDIVSKCLRPYFDKTKTALEVGCGGGFWMERHLIPNFQHATGVDLLPELPIKVDCPYAYIEVGDRDYSLPGIPDNSIDFVWEFGVFCHMSVEAIQAYLASVYRVLKPGGRAVLYFSNTDRRGANPGKAVGYSGSSDIVGWVANNLEKTTAMLNQAGFDECRGSHAKPSGYHRHCYQAGKILPSINRYLQVDAKS